MKKKHILELIGILKQIKPTMESHSFCTLSRMVADFLKKYNPAFNQERFFKSL